MTSEENLSHIYFCHGNESGENIYLTKITSYMIREMDTAEPGLKEVCSCI